MKKSKLLLIGLGVVAATIGLSSCTASFCSVEDKAGIMYAYDIYHVTDANGVQVEDKYTFGISTYYDADDTTKPTSATKLAGFENVYITYSMNTNLALSEINKAAAAEGTALRVNDFTSFWAYVDSATIDLAIEAAKGLNGYNTDKSTMTYSELQTLLMGSPEGDLRGYGYLKYAGKNTKGEEEYWANWNNIYASARADLGVDNCPDSDFVAFYQRQMNTYAATANSCIAITNGFYGYYGFNNENKTEVFISAKDYGYAWSKGFFEGLLIYPISWLIDSTSNAFMGVGAGLAQVLAIFVITFLIRAVMMIVTIKQTTSNARMSEVQPEIAKIQAKYPNSNTNRSEQQSMAMEMQALYKKHNIHPFLSILVMFVQFPVFICVWGAMQGSAVLSSDSFLGLRLSESVSSVFFNFSAWPNNPGWWTGVIVFLIMAVLQVFAMLLPQIITKRKQKAAVARTGKNPAAQKQGNKMKWFTIIMSVMIIFMGFSLASGMVIYWIAGSIWSIAQTLIIELIQHLKKKNKNKPSKPARKAATPEGNIVDAEVLPSHLQAPTGKKKFKNKE